MHRQIEPKLILSFSKMNLSPKYHQNLLWSGLWLTNNILLCIDPATADYLVNFESTNCFLSLGMSLKLRLLPHYESLRY